MIVCGGDCFVFIVKGFWVLFFLEREKVDRGLELWVGGNLIFWGEVVFRNRIEEN